MKPSYIVNILLLAGLLVSGRTLAAPSQSMIDEDMMSTRAKQPFGAYLSILGDPHPTLAGANVAYNAFDFLRATAGLGRVSMSVSVPDASGDFIEEEVASVTSLGVSTKFFVPGWNFSPTIGLGYTHVFFSNVDVASIGSDNLYTNVGVDWQTESGFYVGAGMNVSLTGSAPTAPYLNLGWFLDFTS